MLHVDLPTQLELRSLYAARDPVSVSVYLATTPETQHIGAARIQLGNLVKDALAQLEAGGHENRSILPIREQVYDLIDDEDFWRMQANGLAVLVTPHSLRTYRLPTRLTDTVHVSDRFHLKPLLRAASFPQHAFVLALEENRVRLVEVTGDLPPMEVAVDGLPKSAADAFGVASVNSRSASGRLQGSEGQNVKLRQFVRKVDAALRPMLAGRDAPLILAATDPMLSMFRSVASYPGFAAAAIETSPARMSEADLAAAARPILDALHGETLRAFAELYAQRGSEGRATADVAQAARAATFGAVDTMLVDIDAVVPGTVDPTSGAVTFADHESAATYGVVDEIAGRVLAAGGRVIGVRTQDVPGGGALAAVLRYPV